MEKLPNSIQIRTSVEIYTRGNILSLHYAGTQDAMYKYSGAIFGISARTAREALMSGDAVPYPNSFGIERTI
jgi:hypothetical protein